MPLIIESTDCLPAGHRRCEAVERKGLGHPDSICDAAMEHASRRLCREYLARCGKILHHNLDKGLLVAGRTEPAFGGGKVLEPMKMVLGDRAASECRGLHIDSGGIVAAAVADWMRQNLPRLDPALHVVFQHELKPGSAELADIFDRDVMTANDSSAAVGYAPLTETERLVLEAERFLNGREFKLSFPEAGEDVKVMAYRRDRQMDLTVALALVDRFVADAAAYFARKQAMAETLEEFLRGRMSDLDGISVAINTLDDPSRGLAGVYLTVLGTSAESGDGGAVGRGNPVNGVISLHRPRGAEAAAGKNPVSHVGKIYSVLAHHLSGVIHREVPGLEEVTVSLGSRIGRPIDDPALASVQVAMAPGFHREDAEPAIQGMFEREMGRMDEFIARLVQGDFPIC